MPFDESLAGRVSVALALKRGIEKKKLFGGIGFLLDGNMLVGVWRNSLVVRVGPLAYETALLEQHVREFDITGKPLKGWVTIEPDGLEDDEQLFGWIERATAFVKTLPKKGKVK